MRKPHLLRPQSGVEEPKPVPGGEAERPLIRGLHLLPRKIRVYHRWPDAVIGAVRGTVGVALRKHVQHIRQPGAQGRRRIAHRLRLLAVPLTKLVTASW